MHICLAVLVGLIRVSYVALEYMNKLNGGKGGTIINVASVAGNTTWQVFIKQMEMTGDILFPL